MLYVRRLSRRLFSTAIIAEKFPGAISTNSSIRSLLTLPKDTQGRACGWIRSIRRHKNVVFASVGDGLDGSLLQLVLRPAQAEKLEVGAAIMATGSIACSSGAEQDKEFQVETIEILGGCSGESYPIQKKELTADFLRSIPHLRPRTLHYAAVLRLRSLLCHALRTFLVKEHCTEVHTPVITFSDCEGGGETFRLQDGAELFGRDAFLTVSAQLHAELAAAALGRVYTFGPVFRAESHHTSRHLAEFSMLEVELSFLDNVHALMDFAERMLQEAIITLDLQPISGNGEVEGRREMLLGKYARISYGEAIRLLEEAAKSHPFVHTIEWGRPLQSEHERFLAECIFSKPVFVYDYPAGTKAFYMRSNGDAPDEQWQRGTVACFDLLLPHLGEIIGGSVREERLIELQRALLRFDLNPAKYDWYLDLRRYGSSPHAGFGLGFDRLLQFLTCTSNIRDVVLIPRTVDSAYC